MLLLTTPAADEVTSLPGYDAKLPSKHYSGFINTTAAGGRPMRPDDVDMRWIGAIVARNAAIEETGLGAAVLNHPATGVAWLANRLGAYGDGLKAGEIVLSGSFIRPIEARLGDTISADFGPFGSVSCHFLAA